MKTTKENRRNVSSIDFAIEEWSKQRFLKIFESLRSICERESEKYRNPSGLLYEFLSSKQCYVAVCFKSNRVSFDNNVKDNKALTVMDLISCR